MNAVTTTLASTLKLKIDLTDEQFFQMCQKNRDYRFERTASGELLIMPPTGSDTGRRENNIFLFSLLLLASLASLAVRFLIYIFHDSFRIAI